MARRERTYRGDGRIRKMLKTPATAARRFTTEPRKYARTARELGWLNTNGSTWPISLNNLLRYIAFSYDKGNQPATIATYLSTLAKFHTYKGHFDWKNKIRVHPIVAVALQNIKARHHFPVTKQKEPITVELLEQIKNCCVLSEPHHALFWCIATVAFHTLSRIGELVVPNRQRTAWAVRVANLSLQLDAELPFATITLPRTKVHNPSKPEFIVIKATHDAVCPLTAFLNYMEIRATPQYAP